MRQQFISEPIEPVADTMNTGRMSRGEPGLPTRFRWRDAEHEVAEVLEQWKETSGCRHGSGEQYVRKHWYRIRTASGLEMKLYFERQARSGRERTRRWWLFSVTEPAEA